MSDEKLPNTENGDCHSVDTGTVVAGGHIDLRKG